MTADLDDGQARRVQRMRALLILAEKAEPLPKGTKRTAEARFYEEAREWVPFLVRKYLETTWKK